MAWPSCDRGVEGGGRRWLEANHPAMRSPTVLHEEWPLVLPRPRDSRAVLGTKQCWGQNIDLQNHQQRKPNSRGRRGYLSPWHGPSSATDIISCWDSCKAKGSRPFPQALWDVWDECVCHRVTFIVFFHTHSLLSPIACPPWGTDTWEPAQVMSFITN